MTDYKRVPVEPTDEMIIAASAGEVHTADVQSAIRRRALTIRRYKAMLAAAPKPDDEQKPFGYFDHFNNYLYTGGNALEQAKLAEAGYNLITPLYASPRLDDEADVAQIVRKYKMVQQQFIRQHDRAEAAEAKVLELEAENAALVTCAAGEILSDALLEQNPK